MAGALTSFPVAVGVGLDTSSPLTSCSLVQPDHSPDFLLLVFPGGLEAADYLAQHSDDGLARVLSRYGRVSLESGNSKDHCLIL